MAPLEAVLQDQTAPERIFQVTKSQSLNFQNSSSLRICCWRAFTVALVPLFLSACVPYVKYDDVVSKLERANRVNTDMEKRLKDSQLTGFQGDAQLQRASARIKVLESDLQITSDERDVLEDANKALQVSLEEIKRDAMLSVGRMESAPLHMKRQALKIAISDDELKGVAAAVFGAYAGLMMQELGDPEGINAASSAEKLMKVLGACFRQARQAPV